MTSQQGSTSKYDLRLNPVYQVDWQNAASGKRVSATKRRIRWRFGFSNADAISQGMTGTDCRGEEHEVSIVWSLTSGKRLVMADGVEVYFSNGKRTDTRFETSWTMSGGHILKVIAHAAPPLLKTPGFRQFDLLLDGCSYFQMPKIFELGTKRSTKLAMTSVPRSPTAAYNNYSLSASGYVKREEAYESQSTPVRRSAPALEQHQAPVSTPQAAPVDMLSDPAPGHTDLFDSPVAVIEQSPVADAFSPQPPSFNQVSDQILGAYNPPTTTTMPANTVLALANESHTHMVPQQQQQYQTPQQQQTHYQATPQPQQQYQGQQQQYQSPQQQQQQAYYQQHAPATVSPDASMSSMMSYETSPATTPERAVSPPVVTLTMAPMSIEELESRDQPPMSAMDKAVKSLVNLEDINETIVTPELRKAEQKKLEKQPITSKPLPPTAPEWHFGPTPALNDLKQQAPKAPPAREIMRTHAFDPAAVQAGMLVVYGSTAPPQPQGFGAGAHMSHYGQQQMPQQQQQVAYYGQPQQQQMYAAY